jgi:toxin-antitoxin system PIN domain toxin
MIAPDTNLLLYAYHPESLHHAAAKAWLEEILSGAEPVGFPLPVIHAFIRLLTNPAIAGRIVTLTDTLSIVDDWLTLPQVSILLPGDRHWQLLKKVTLDGYASANLVPDAVIAAIAMEYGATIHTNDRDFARFPNLRWHNPLTTY